MRWLEPSAATTDSDVAAIDLHGFVVIEALLSAEEIAEMRRLLDEPLREDLRGRNDFEGHCTQRIYALVARGKPFEDLVRHPRVLAICDRFLEPNYLLTASQAICIHAGETPQPLHADDTFYSIPRPRPPVSMSTIVALDAFTEANGGTQVLPGSHRWSDDDMRGVFQSVDFATLRGGAPRDADERAGDAALADRLVPLEMPAGSAVVFAGTLVHRGGGGRSQQPRLALSNQYCQPWARQQENYTLGISPAKVRAMHERLRRLLGFSIHPPFMGHFGGLHPERMIAPDGRKPR